MGSEALPAPPASSASHTAPAVGSEASSHIRGTHKSSSTQKRTQRSCTVSAASHASSGVLPALLTSLLVNSTTAGTPAKSRHSKPLPMMIFHLTSCGTLSCRSRVEAIQPGVQNSVRDQSGVGTLHPQRITVTMIRYLSHILCTSAGRIQPRRVYGVAPDCGIIRSMSYPQHPQQQP